MPRQRTLRSSISCVGVGLHSGKDVRLELKPAEVDSGIIFLRTDLPTRPAIHATAANVTATLRATTLEENGAKVFTIEHLMSALNACRIDNCTIEISAEEPPVLDGNSIEFFRMIRAAGIVEQSAERKIIRLDKIYRVDGDEGKRFIMALPYDGLRVSFVSVNPHPLIGIQYADFEITEEIYEREIAPARTIAYEKEVDALRAMGLGLGGTLENVIVYNDAGWLNKLNYPDELVRHKILDVIGDLRLAGIFNCHIVAAASGHALNTQLAKKIYSEF
ncbi:MAG: UDP-3-O-[3-hydroxymyristoyl] N-acetylglucosamine deacetylase [Selenomonadaceae bacterium]|nr:UDP-3-O-[3-hydroxymyristoyl] N-acetylglucosamine deacetylase [Selenomonadaceae bacterium]